MLVTIVSITLYCALRKQGCIVKAAENVSMYQALGALSKANVPQVCYRNMHSKTRSLI